MATGVQALEDRQAAMNLRSASHLVFAVTMIGVGLVGLLTGGFAVIWEPVPKTFPAREILPYLCAVIAIASGAGMLSKRTRAAAALVLFLYLAVWTIMFRVPLVVRAPLVEGPYQNCGESAVLISAAWLLYGSVARDVRANLKFLTGGPGLRAAQILYGLALLAFGFSHFAYLNLTAPLVPKWLPWPVFWAYLTGTVYIATGISIVIGLGARVAADVAAVQIALITGLVWGNLALAGPLSPVNRGETLDSWALTAGAWVIAASFDPRSSRGLIEAIRQAFSPGGGSVLPGRKARL